MQMLVPVGAGGGVDAGWGPLWSPALEVSEKVSHIYEKWYELGPLWSPALEVSSPMLKRCMPPSPLRTYPLFSLKKYPCKDIKGLHSTSAQLVPLQ
jgi:hypothetical protein